MQEPEEFDEDGVLHDVGVISGVVGVLVREATAAAMEEGGGRASTCCFPIETPLPMKVLWSGVLRSFQRPGRSRRRSARLPDISSSSRSARC